MSSLTTGSETSSTHDDDSLNDPQLDLEVGALVIYGGHGLGRVSRAPAGGSGSSAAGSVEVKFASGLSITLPLERAVSCLRPIADVEVLARVQAALRHEGAVVEKTWQERTRTTKTKIAEGGVVGLAEVVRDAVTRQKQSASGALSTFEGELYVKARHLLAIELGAAIETDEAGGNAWIDSQLETSAVG